MLNASFKKTIEAIKQFAIADAARFRLRDVMRFEVLSIEIESKNSVFIEAGVIHYLLWQLLWGRFRFSAVVRPFFLADSMIKQTDRKRHLYGPGDLLTFFHIFHPGKRKSTWENLMAALSIVHSKIIWKEEAASILDNFSHLQDEIQCIEIANSLTVGDCETLFKRIRLASTQESRRIVTGYIRGRHG